MTTDMSITLTTQAAKDLGRESRRVDGKPAVYVCQNYTCKKPVTTPAELKTLIE